MTKQLEALIAKIKKQTESFDTVVLKEDEANALIAALEQSNNLEAQASEMAVQLSKRLTAAEKRVAELGEEQKEFAEALGCAGDNESILEAIDGLKTQVREIDMSNSVLQQQMEASPLALPEGMHPDTATLVINFAEALAAKLRKAEIKYGYDSDWKKEGWQGQCLAHFHQHIGKGDPLDVAAYCAFMWHHKWPTAASPLAVKLPPHKYRECVNGLLEEAISYAGTQQLRSRLSARLSNFVSPDHAIGGQVEGE